MQFTTTHKNNFPKYPVLLMLLHFFSALSSLVWFVLETFVLVHIQACGAMSSIVLRLCDELFIIVLK